MRFILPLILILAACTNPPYKGSDVCGADDFVLDSYEIQQGKFAILGMEGFCTECLDCSLLEEYRDVIGDGDVLSIAIHHPTRGDLSNTVSLVGHQVGYRVMEGKVFLPNIGSCKVGGLTLIEAKEAIEETYRGEIRDVDVFLSYQERKRGKVELMGMVDKPTIPVDGKIRLFEVLSEARVPPIANLFKSYVVRDGCMLPVDLYKLVKEGDMCQNIVMRGGDKIYIAEPSSSSLMVLGEVGQQRVIDLPNGFMTLRQAIATAGGISLTGDKRYIQVIRGNIVHPKIYTLHWQHVVRLPSDSLLLIPGDIVYVAATPLTEWDRFVNQILPTLVGLDLIMQGSKSVGIIVP